MAYQRFLICESDELVRQSIRGVIDGAGHEVLAIPDAPAALEALLTGEFVCAFIDIDRLDSNAFEIPQALRGKVLKRTPRLLAMTARGSARDFQLARDAGFDTCLKKPINSTPLIVVLAQLHLQPWVKRPPWKQYRKQT
ncbi:hypothetical protein BH11MYX2_BH11MYX2_15690 [soil metagenome]